MDTKKILSYVDHTLLAPNATQEQIFKLCDDAIEYGVASVCIPPSFVAPAKAYVLDKLKICTVIGFPNGYATTKTKVFETKDALANGADEIDMVINIGDLMDERYDAILTEISEIKHTCYDKILKVIIEACVLNDEQKIKMCELVSIAGADFIKTSTGFSTGGATREDVALFRKHISPKVQIKAAGGIATLCDAEDFILLGATRLGTSRIVKIMQSQEFSDKSY